jgi:hypothetical protein
VIAVFAELDRATARLHAAAEGLDATLLEPGDQSRNGAF